jgi:hypothetical protein
MSRMSWLIVLGMRRLGFVSVLGEFCLSLEKRGFEEDR